MDARISIRHWTLVGDVAEVQSIRLSMSGAIGIPVSEQARPVGSAFVVRDQPSWNLRSGCQHRGDEMRQPTREGLGVWDLRST
jgi:hypothetical protein